MKAKLINLILISFLALISITSYADQLDTQLQNSIQNYLTQNQTTLHISAVQLSVWLPNETQSRNYVAGTQYYGVANAPATTNMMLEWGSVTKEYTNLLIFQLINQGKLQLNETLGQIFPEQFDQNNSNSWPARWKDIQIVQLMNMTSGISSYTFLPPFNSAMNFYTNPNQQYTFDEMINTAANFEKQDGCIPAVGCFPPGTAMFYSNTNYIILGLIVQKVNNANSFTDVMNAFLQSIQQPGNQIYYYVNPLPANLFANMIHGYINLSNGGISQTIAYGDSTAINLSWAASAGALTGNMTTLASMEHRLYLNQLVPAPFNINQLEQDAVEVPSGQAVTNPETQCNLQTTNGCYAMGLLEAYIPQQQSVFWWYEGDAAGYTTVYLWDQQLQLLVAISTNSNNAGDQSAPNSLFNEALEINNQIRQYLNSTKNK